MNVSDPGQHPSLRRGCSSADAGFTLIEALVATALITAVLIGVLTFFDRQNQLARTQTHIADMQGALRTGQQEMMRAIRMAGRGGIPRGPMPAGLAVSVRNNAPESGDGSTISLEDDTSPAVMPGTDVLTVRGAFNAPIYQVNPLAGDLILDDPDNPTVGSIRLRNPHTTTGVAQDLQAMIDAVEVEEHAALLLVSPVDSWAVVEIDREQSDVTDPTDIRVRFSVGAIGGTDIKDRYLELSGGWPASLRTVSHVSILEEYRFFVREEFAWEGDDESQVVPRLMRARFYPNTETPHPSEPDFGAEIADNILDLQVSLGIDTDGDAIVTEGGTEGDGPTLSLRDDDWLFNTPEDSDADGEPLEPEKWNPIGGTAPLYYVRLTTTARTDRADLGYQAPELELVEDKDFSETPHDRFNETGERRYRRRTLETVVDLRNL